MKLASSSKKYQKYIAALMLAVFVLQLFPAQAQAADNNEIPMCTVGNPLPMMGEKFDFVCAILTALDYLVTGLMYYPLIWIEGITNDAIDLNRDNPQANVYIQKGFITFRNIANMFFVFILLWIALATIFDVQAYSAKTLLPRFIIAALLINFSMAIGSEVVKFSNTLAKAFSKKDIPMVINVLTSPIKRMVEQSKSATDYGLGANDYTDEGTVYNKIMQSQKTTITENYKLPDGTPDIVTLKGTECLTRAELKRSQQSYLQQGSSLSTGGMPSVLTRIDQDVSNSNPQGSFVPMSYSYNVEEFERESARNKACLKLDGRVHLEAANLLGAYRGGDYSHKKYAAEIFIKFLFQIIVLFTLGALIMLLLIRHFSLSFVLMLGPMAFVGMVLPTTQRWYHEWWEALFKWSFFFPAFTIFFSVGTTMMADLMGNRYLGVNSRGSLGDTLFAALLGGGMMIGGLIAAQKIGIGAANTAMNFGKKWANTAKDWTKKKAIDRSKMARDAAASGALAIGGSRVPLLGKKLQTWAGERNLRDVKAKKEDIKRLSSLSDKDLGSVLRTAGGKDAASIMENLDKDKTRKALRTMSVESKNRLTDKLRTENGEHFMRELDEDPRSLLYAYNSEVANKEFSDPAAYKGELQNMINTKFSGKNAKNLSPQFIASELGKTWLKENATGEQISVISNSSTEHLRALVKALTEKVDEATGNIEKIDVNPDEFKGAGARELLQSAAGRALFRNTTARDEYGFAYNQAPQRIAGEYKTAEEKETIAKETYARVEKAQYNKYFEQQKKAQTQKIVAQKRTNRNDPDFNPSFEFVSPVTAYSIKLQQETRRMEDENKKSPNPLPPQTIRFEAERAAKKYAETMRKIEEEVGLYAASIAGQEAQKAAQKAVQDEVKKWGQNTPSQSDEPSLKDVLKALNKLEEKDEK